LPVCLLERRLLHVCLLEWRLLPLLLLANDVDCLPKICESRPLFLNVLPPSFDPLGRCLPSGDSLLLLTKYLDLLLRPLTPSLRLGVGLILCVLARLELAKTLAEMTGVRCLRHSGLSLRP
jgi:hypothetical protein